MKNIIPLLAIVIITGLFAVGVFFLFYGEDSSPYEFLSDASVQKENSANILNLHSHPQQGESWIVSFQTQGRADLKIVPDDQATIEDDEFVALYCGEEQRTPQIMEGDAIYYKNWECNGKAQVIHYTKKAGKHALRFEFGTQIMYAYNSAAWHNPAWTKRKKITIDNTNVDSDLANFPLYVDITSDSDIGGSAQADGDDILFTSDDGITQLPHEEESFSVTEGSATGHYWVNVPLIYSSTTTDIYVYYGNSNAADSQQAEKVWDSNYKGVWHMTSNGGTEYDSSKSGEDLTETSGTIPTATGKIGNARSFASADTEYLYHADGGSTEINGADQPVTVSAWITRASDSGAIEAVVAKWDSVSNNRSYMLAVDEFECVSGYLSANGISYAKAVGITVIPTDSSWQYLVMVYDDTTVSAYLNGAVNLKLNENPLSYNSGIFNGTATFMIGARGGSATGYWNGLIDEARVANDARTAAEVKFEYNNMAEADNELTWAEAETVENPINIIIK